MLDTVYKKVSRNLVMAACFWLPEERKVQLERWVRGRHEAGRLARSDVVIASFGKSGRTWLRVMLSGFYQIRFGVSENALLGGATFSRRDPAIPRLFFTHDNYIKDYTGNVDSKADFYDRRVVLLVRDPRDVTVSQYFQWLHRMKDGKTRVNHFPPRGTDVSLFDFVMDPVYGLVRCVDFLNLWAREAHAIRNLLIVRYEDMRQDPARELARVVEFLGHEVEPDVIARAVEHGSIENMRKQEATNTFTLAGGRLKPGDRANPDSYKVRRAKVGGYRDYFSDEEVEAIDKYVAENLAPELGYGPGGVVPDFVPELARPSSGAATGA